MNSVLIVCDQNYSVLHENTTKIPMKVLCYVVRWQLYQRGSHCVEEIGKSAKLEVVLLYKKACMQYLCMLHHIATECAVVFCAVTGTFYCN